VNMRALVPAAGLALLLAACGGSSAPVSSSAPASPASAAAKPAGAAPASAAASAKPAASAVAKPAASGASAKPAASGAAAAKPAANPTFTDGAVASVDASKLTLAEGNKAFTLTQSTSYVKLQKETPADVKSGQFVAITAKEQPDNTLLASFVRLQDSSGGRPANQYPMDQFANGQPVTGNLMTNAPVKSADANGMVVTLPGGDVTVKYAPGVQIVHQAQAAASDVKAGAKVLVLSRGDAALNVGVYV
jgi:uncharacterized protein DUF5666